MKKTALVSIIAFFVILATSSYSLPEEKSFDESLVLKILYSDFLTIKSFGNIRIVFVGEDAKKIGLNEDELTDYLKLRFKNSFARIPYKDESKNFSDILNDEEKTKKIGSLIVRVGIVGDDYPIAYHIQISAGSLHNMRTYENAFLGYGSKRDVPDTIKKTISNMVDEMAIQFFKTRGEL